MFAEIVRVAVESLCARRLRYGVELLGHLKEMLSRYPKMAETYRQRCRPNNQLFQASDRHVKGTVTVEESDVRFITITALTVEYVAGQAEVSSSISLYSALRNVK